MTIDSIFRDYKSTTKFELKDDKDISISLIREEPFYIVPLVVDLDINKESKIIVISAPGATGKSSLAKYLAYRFSSLYWNLADITLGDNSFVGTIVRSIGSESYSEYINALLNGESILIIDAFDEAEMISGVRAVRTFISDISKATAKAKRACVVMLARAETASNICSFMRERGIIHSHYEISFFERNKSEEFIKKIAIHQQPSFKNNRLLDDCIKQYLNIITRMVQNESDANSFVGYAPVLEVIGKHVASEKNAYVFLNNLESENVRGIDIINRILQELMEREQGKVKESLIKRIGEKLDSSSFDNDSVYTVEEQMKGLLSYVLFQGYDEQICLNKAIPDEIKDEYSEICRTFLPQHPFLRNKADGRFDFAGPAFRDYVLAKTMQSENNEELIQWFLEEKRINQHFPSHLLWAFFTNRDNVVIPAKRIPYLFDSFKSQSKGNAQSFLTVEGTSETGYFSVWSICASNPQKDTIENYEVQVEDGLCFENVNNSIIDVDDLPVYISNASENVQISHSTINCQELKILAERITFDVYDGSECTLVSKNNVEIKSLSSGTSDITVNGNNLFIDFPNIEKYYKLIKYKFQFMEDNKFPIGLFIFLLRKIMVEFRKHGKDAPAKDAEKIDYVIIGDDSKRKAVFGFLLEQGIIYQDQDTHLYKMNTQNLSTLEISWGAIIKGDKKQLANAYHHFEEYLITISG